MKLKQKIKEAELIIFDFDGSIVNSLDVFLHAFKKALLAFSQKYKLKEIKKKIGPKSHIVISRLMKNHTRSKLKRADIIFYNSILMHANEVKPFKDAIAAIKKLSKIKKLALLTNSKKEYIKKTLPRIGLKDSFRMIVCGDSGFRNKSSGLKHIIKTFKASSEKTIYIGDAALDAKAAKMARCVSVAIIRWFPLREIKKENPDYIIRSMDELY